MLSRFSLSSSFSHVALPQFKMIVYDFDEPFPLGWILKYGCDCFQIEGQHGLVTKKRIQSSQKVHVAVELENRRIREEVKLNSEVLRGPCLNGGISACGLNFADVFGVPGGEVRGEFGVGQIGHSLRFELFLYANVNLRRVDEHLK
ncbi:hypothetical protein RUM44_007903 [Polyplax serrata]|uniref:Uncharacterized protein n=1 Tax=Polyplax serrata TaxID=468196 RepID=A0ABR1B7E5_POLSC